MFGLYGYLLMSVPMMVGGTILAAIIGFLGAHAYETYVGGLRKSCSR